MIWEIRWQDAPASFCETYGDVWSGNFKDQLAHLRGEFAHIAYENGAATVFRDPLGVIPVYYHRSNHSLLVSTRLLELAERVRARHGLTLNRRYFQALWWDQYSLTEESPYNEILRLPPGRRLVARQDHTSVQNYRTLQTSNVPTTLEQGQFRVMSDLQSAVEQRLATGRKVSILLSGGFDSTLLAKMAKARADLITLDFQTPSAREKDLPVVLSHLSGRSLRVDYDEKDPVYRDDDVRLLTLYSPNFYFYRKLLQVATKAESQVVWTGLGGDDLFSQPLVFLASLLKRGWLRSWSACVRELDAETSWGTILRASVFPSLPSSIHSWYVMKRKFPAGGFLPDGWERSALEAEIKSSLIEQRHLSAEAYHRNIIVKILTGGHLAFALEQEQELAQAFGLRMSYPLLDFDLVQTVLSLEPEHFFPQFQQKGLLRRSSRRVIPPQLAHRVSEQAYHEPVHALMKDQSSVFDTRIKKLGRDLSLGPSVSLHQTLEHRRIFNYAYKINEFASGVNDEQAEVPQKNLSETEA